MASNFEIEMITQGVTRQKTILFKVFDAFCMHHIMMVMYCGSILFQKQENHLKPMQYEMNFFGYCSTLKYEPKDSRKKINPGSRTTVSLFLALAITEEYYQS